MSINFQGSPVQWNGFEMRLRSLDQLPTKWPNVNSNSFILEHGELLQLYNSTRESLKTWANFFEA